jgi:hypothetical protein
MARLFAPMASNCARHMRLSQTFAWRKTTAGPLPTISAASVALPETTLGKEFM